MDAEQSLPQVESSTIILALGFLALTAATQHSHTAELCGLSNHAFSAWHIYRASPIVCFLDSLFDIFGVIKSFLKPATPIAEKLEQQPVYDIAEYHVTSKWRMLQWALFVLLGLPSAFVLMVCKSILAAQVCAGLYTSAIISHAALEATLGPRRLKKSDKDLLVHVLCWHGFFLSAIWTLPQWSCMAYLSELSGWSQELAVFKLCILAGMILLLLSALVAPWIPGRWRLSNSTLMVLQLGFALNMTSNYTVKNNEIVQKHVWEFLGTFSWGVTAALLLPTSVAVLFAVPLFWLGTGSVRSVVSETADPELGSSETAPGPVKGVSKENMTYLTQVKAEGWRLLTHGIYCYNNFMACAGWYRKLLPEVQELSLLVLGVMTMVLYFGMLHEGEKTSMPRWLHEMLQGSVAELAMV